MSSMACRRVLISVSNEVSYEVTGREVSEIVLFSADRRLVRRFSQFCKHTDERTCNDSDSDLSNNNNAICKEPKASVPVCIIENKCNSDV